jgi:hypothetical protein
MQQQKANPFQSQPKPQVIKPFGQSPIELGGSKAAPNKALTLGEHLDGALNFVADSLFGFGSDASSSNSKDSSSDSNSSNNPFAEALKKEQEKNSELSEQMKKQKHQAQHKEMQMTEVFDLEKKKSEQLIRQIKEELAQLVVELNKMGGNVDQSIQTAIASGNGEAGKYYENFFVQLRNFLVLLTKRVKEGNTWLQAFNSKKGKSLYERNSAQYGSQYQFGQEGHGLVRSSG